MNTYEMLDKIKHHPGMYLGAENLSYLSRFISGYNLGLRETGYRYEQLYPLPFPELFLSYCKIKYQETRNVGYETMILDECEQNEKKALWRFFEILDEFKQNAGITNCEICELSRDNISFHLTNNHVIKKGVYRDGSWVCQPAYAGVERLYHITLSYGADLLIPVSEDENIHGNLLYNLHEDENALNIFEALNQHMDRCFGEVVWHKLEANDELLLHLINDYIFNGKKTK